MGRRDVGLHSESYEKRQVELTAENTRVRIGVDELFQAKGRWWCHLVCDDFSPRGLQRLHEFARNIGVPDAAFHDPSGHPRPHYDLRPEYRERAVARGAEILSRKNLVEFLHRGRERLQSRPVPEQ